MDVVSSLIDTPSLLESVATVVRHCVAALHRGNKMLFAGNGGSAADAQHLAAEMVSRFAFDRPALPAIALTTDTSVLTAIGNDYGFEQVFARQVRSIGKSGDILFGITTSGRSRNVILALEAARELGIITVGMTGGRPAPIDHLLDHAIRVPSSTTSKIQEAHIILGHTICGLIESRIFAAR